MLYNLDGILKESLLLAAEPRLQPKGSGQIRAPHIETTQAWRDLPNGERPIWEYQPRGLTKLERLTVRNRLMNFDQATVADKIEWGPVSVETLQGRKYHLPLTEQFRLRSYFLPIGDIRDGDSRLWPLATCLHNSYQHVFGYEVDLRSRQLVPISKKAIDHPELMYPVDDQFDLRKESERRYVCYVTPLRFVVCLAMGCSAERNDFEPGGVLYAGRLRPSIMVMANMKVKAIEGTLTLERPMKAAHCHDPEMGDSVGAILFTDRNVTPVTQITLPYWDQIFDYYDASPKLGDSFMATSDRGERIRKNTVAAWPTTWPLVAGRAQAYEQRDVRKLARQGEFDSVHIAPKMIASPSVVEKHPHLAETLRNIAMAPFCIHDCLHTHWRWYDGFRPKKWTAGWSGTADDPGDPYAEQNVPQVPPNQQVKMTLIGQCGTPHGYKYEAVARNPHAGEWQVIFHHGAAYALDTTKVLGGSLPKLMQTFLMQMEGGGLVPGDSFQPRWSLFYWHLRYALLGGGTEAHERLLLSRAKLAELRSL